MKGYGLCGEDVDLINVMEVPVISSGFVVRRIPLPPVLLVWFSASSYSGPSIRLIIMVCVDLSLSLFSFILFFP